MNREDKAAISTVRSVWTHMYLDGSRPTPESITDAMLAGYTGDKRSKVLVLFDVVLAAKMCRIGYKNVTLLVGTDSPVTQRTAEIFGFDVITQVEHNMRFNLVIGNPPFQEQAGESTNTSELFVDFIDLAFDISNTVAMVIPASWAGAKNSRVKKTLFVENQPELFCLHGRDQWFGVSVNTCHFVVTKGRKGKTVVTDMHGNEFVEQLTDNSFFGDDLERRGLISKISSKAIESNLGQRWLRGKLTLNNVEKKRRGVAFIPACGYEGEGLETIAIDPKVESTGFGINKLVMPNVAGRNSDNGVLGNIKIADKEMVGGHSVVFLTGKSKKEVTNIKHYLELPVMKKYLNAIKTSTPNAKSVFAMVPEVDFSRKWTNEEVMKHFKLTKKDVG